MKIRWTEKSVRFRITPRELEQLQSGAEISEELRLGEGGWRALIIPAASQQTSLHCVKGALHLLLGKTDLQTLSQPDEEGVYFQPGEKIAVRCILEKDFPCAHPRAADAHEPTTETFAPPPDFEARKS